MLKVQDLWVSVEDKQILKGVNLSMNYGEINVLFGPNGAGKTTFMMALMGFQRYKIEQGKIFFKGEDITGRDLYERARLGLGISFQRPPTVKGVSLKKMIEIIKNNGTDKERLNENIALGGEAINALLGKDKVKDQKRGAIIITHTGYILDFVNADKGFIIFDGNLVCRGNPRDILSEIKKHGYRRCAECR